MELAKQHIESQNPKCRVVGGFLSPTHQTYCDSKLQTLSIAAKHRIAMISLAVRDSDWLSVSPWHPQQSKMQAIESEIAYIEGMARALFRAHEQYKRFQMFFVC